MAGAPRAAFERARKPFRHRFPGQRSPCAGNLRLRTAVYRQESGDFTYGRSVGTIVV